MERANVIKAAQRIGFAGEQIISYIDEVSRTPCPQCGECDLRVTIVGKNIIIRCSEEMQDYNDYAESEVIPVVCDYVQVIKKTNLSQPPFSFKFDEGKRGTSRNSQPPTRRRRRKAP